MARPTTLPVWATAGGATLTPSGGKQAAGWTVNERPAARHMNWFQNLVYQWLSYLDAISVTRNDAASRSARTAWRNAVPLYSDAAFTQQTGFCASASPDEALSVYRFYASAAGGKIFVSQSGAVSGWGSVSAGSGYTGNLFGITSAPSQGLILAYGASGEIQSCTDGAAVFTRRLGGSGGASFVALSSMAGQPYLVAARGDGHIWSSTTGTSFTDRGDITSGVGLNDVASGLIGGNPRFLAIGAATVYLTPDGGTSWAPYATVGAGLTVANHIAYSTELGLWAIAGHAASNVGGVWTSPDGLTWTRVFTETNGAAGTTMYVDACPGGFLVSGQSTSSRPMFTADGLTWAFLPRLAGSLDQGTINPRKPLAYVYDAPRSSALILASQDFSGAPGALGSLFISP